MFLVPCFKISKKKFFDACFKIRRKIRKMRILRVLLELIFAGIMCVRLNC